LRAGTPSRRARTQRSTRNLADDAARVAGRENAVGKVGCDDAARADHGPRSDAHAGQDAGAAPDPSARADRYRLAELLAPAHLGIEGMRRGVDLHGRAEKREAADADMAHVQHDAIEIEEHALAELDVRAVVAIERRLHPHGLAACTEELAQQVAPLLLGGFRRGVQRPAKLPRAVAACYELGVPRIVGLAGQHLLALGPHAFDHTAA